MVSVYIIRHGDVQYRARCLLWLIVPNHKCIYLFIFENAQSWHSTCVWTWILRPTARVFECWNVVVLSFSISFDIKQTKLYKSNIFPCLLLYNSFIFLPLFQATSAKVDLQCCLELYNLAASATETIQERKRTSDERSLSSGELPTNCPCNSDNCDCKQSSHNRSASVDFPLNVSFFILFDVLFHLIFLLVIFFSKLFFSKIAVFWC